MKFRMELYLIASVMAIGAALMISCGDSGEDHSDDSSPDDGVDRYFACEGGETDCCVYECDCQCDDGCDLDEFIAVGKASDFNDLCFCETICQERCAVKGCEDGNGEGLAFINQFTRPVQ